MKNTANLLRVLGVFAIIIIFTVLTGCDTTDDPKPTPPVIPTVSITTATALPSTTPYGGKSKVTVVAENATSIEVLEDGKVIKTGNGQIEFETDQLFKTTKYTVVAKNNNQSKTADLTIIVGEIHPKLKLLLEGKWQLVKSELKRPGETTYSDSPNNPCRLDDTFVFYLNNTCITTWGPSTCFPDEAKLGTSIYYGGFDTSKMILLWQQVDPWDVIELTDKKLRIHTMSAQWGDFTILSDYIQEYKNVK